MSGWDGYDVEQARDGYYANPAAAAAELRAYEADEGPLGCNHEDDELDGDEHRANCLYDPRAARRLAWREGRWDGQGVSEWSGK